MDVLAGVGRGAALGFLGLPHSMLRRLAGPPRRSPEGFDLDVQLQALLHTGEVFGATGLHQLGLSRARRSVDRLSPALDWPLDPTVHTEDRTLPGSTVALRIYQPASPPAPRPLLVYFHGGGFVLGSIGSHHGTCAALCARAGVTVVSVGYRLAPEYRFPAAVDDAVASFRWAASHAIELGSDPSASAVCGDSAGGTLAARVCHEVREDAVRPVLQVLVYPGTDLTRSSPSHSILGEGYFLSRETLDWFVRHYAPDPATHRDPRASPLFAPDLSGLPRALVLTAGFDPLRDEGLAYAQRLRDAGVPVEHRRFEGLVHGFFTMAGAIEAARPPFDLVVSALRSLRTAASPDG